ncbi:hypothetical protein A2154_03365 [Candidatus Gottesmanbacteria bacterium RBG_16_43_7]|uniref:Uncharacterized protein n=1 Tax=Candidatus Gottesmanbacteria bacterium RBG_16_43_7 TaxID=1798373 RepID=A0A1F5Z998_9BACT|nr:MAG: hypothetical protein A2154_03365 [Candidatus Gottesmanbacteria bacterium RBG_16_43_7]
MEHRTTFTRILSILFFILIFSLLALLYQWESRRFEMKFIYSFMECKNQGYPILETDPPQCRLPDGRVFTDTNGD